MTGAGAAAPGGAAVLPGDAGGVRGARRLLHRLHRDGQARRHQRGRQGRRHVCLLLGLRLLPGRPAHAWLHEQCVRGVV